MSKTVQYHDKNAGELQQALSEQQQKLHDLRLEVRLQKSTNHAELRKIRKDIARIRTTMNAQKEAPSA